jgi:hypothetical protein
VPGKGYLDERKTRREQAAAAASEAEAETERLEQLERLGKLHETGVLSDEEFAEEKTRILGPDEE